MCKLVYYDDLTESRPRLCTKNHNEQQKLNTQYWVIMAVKSKLQATMDFNDQTSIQY